MKYDCIIIGGGHNGLVAAAYMAKAGARVLVLEARHILGGCASTEELWSGFKVSPAAYVISLFLPQIIDDLRLKQNGLEILPRIPSSFTPDLNGPGLVLSNDIHDNVIEIAQYSSSDASSYPNYEDELMAVASVIEPLLVNPPPNLLSKNIFERATAFQRSFTSLRGFSKLGDKIPDAVEILTGDAATILNRWFDSDILKATLAGDAVIGSFTSPYNPGSSYILLHHVMGEAGGARGVWGYIRGGMGGLADALEKVCKSLGVVIHREAPVKEINVNAKQVEGVTTESGRIYDSKLVASNIDANKTMQMVKPGFLPSEYKRRLARIDYSSASAKINMAIDGLPNFVGMDKRENISGLYNGTIHISPSIDYIDKAYFDGRHIGFSVSPMLEITLPSVVDDTLAPPGQHVMQIFVQYASNKTDWHESNRKQFFDNCMYVLERYAPGIKNQILHHQMLLPPDLEKIYGLTGGNIMQGAMSLHQMGPLRMNYKTPIRGLYLCGAATSPGGGVMGACGRNAARAML